MYVASAFATPCAVRPIVQKERTWIYLIPGLVAGAMTAIEVPSRQLGKYRVNLGLLAMTRECLHFGFQNWVYTVCHVPWNHGGNFSSRVDTLAISLMATLLYLCWRWELL